MSDPDASSPADAPLPLTSPRTPLQLSFPFLREGSRVWERERKPPQPGELPSPLPTKRTRTYSAWVGETWCSSLYPSVIINKSFIIALHVKTFGLSFEVFSFFSRLNSFQFNYRLCHQFKVIFKKKPKNCLCPCLSFSAGQCEPDQVQYLKVCVKTSPGLRVMDSYGPLAEERTSLSTSQSEWISVFLTSDGFVEVDLLFMFLR